MEDINVWVAEFGKLNYLNWNVRTSVPNGQRIMCSKKFVCQHSGFQKPSMSENQKGLSKNAECPANVKAVIKLDTVSTRKKDPFIKKGLVCCIEIYNHHTHTIKSAESLRFISAGDDVKNMFYEYFDSGMGIAESQKYHEQLLELKEDFTLEHFANGGINPCYRTKLKEKQEIYSKNGITVLFKENPFAVFVCVHWLLGGGWWTSPSFHPGQAAPADVVVMLLETPFRRWNSDSKNDLLKMGKPIPILSALAPDKKLSKVFCRSFNPNLYQQHSWLCGSHYIQKLFCWPCLLLGKMKSVWNTVEYYDLKNLSRGIQIHQTSKEHIHNHLGLKNLEKNCFTILDVVNEHVNLFKKNYNENMRLNRLFMEHLIDLVLVLGKQELAFRGHDESSDSLNKGNFRELFEMHIIRCSREIQNHYNSIKNIFTGMSKSIQNDLISCISEFLINQIKNEIKQCKFYSIQIDDTTDISQKTQCSIIIRYVTDKSELIERFLGFHNVSEDRTAQDLFNLVNSVLHEFDIENKLVGQCYDGACVMSGHLTGLQARVKEVAPNALFTHCLAHRLNLVLQHGCSINAKCRIFFANLTGIAAYFHNSTSRTNFVDTIVGKRIPQFVQTRWSSRSKILHTIVNEWSGFIDVFDCISKDPKSSSESIFGAIGHFKNLKTFEFAFLALIFSDIFIYTDNLFNILQIKSFDVEFCLRKINITYDLINKKRNKPEFLKLFNQAVTLTKPPKTTRNESNNQSSFKILFYEIIDNILMQLNTRFQDTNKLLFLQLADVTKFKEYSCKFPVNALNNLKSTYPNIFYNINSLKVELEVLYSDVKYQNLLHIYDMVKIIEQDALKDILPEAYKLFILILTIPSTSVSNERSFSSLKRIKTCSRNSISQVRFSSLSILSIEKSLINELKKSESFYDDIINMYSSQKVRSINLTYKT
ncbi:hypothetical protein QTP88_017616 [Uroleucon formosanum]